MLPVRRARGLSSTRRKTSEILWMDVRLDGSGSLDRPGLRLNAIDRLDQLCASVRCGVRQDDQADPVTFPPDNVGAVGNILRQRRQQHTVEGFLRDPIFLGARLRMTADGYIPQTRNVPVEVIHARLKFSQRLRHACLNVLGQGLEFRGPRVPAADARHRHDGCALHDQQTAVVVTLRAGDQ